MAPPQIAGAQNISGLEPDSLSSRRDTHAHSSMPQAGCRSSSGWLSLLASVTRKGADGSCFAFPSRAAIDQVRVRGDSCGGEVTCVVRGCPKGLGSPVFDKLEAELAKAFMSLPASKARPCTIPCNSLVGDLKTLTRHASAPVLVDGVKI